MSSTRGKRTAAWTIGLGLAVLAVTGVALRDHLLDQLAIWRLGDEDPEVRARAAVRLGERRVARAVPGLVAAMKEDQIIDDSPARVAVLQIGTAAVPGLTAVLDGGDEESRWYAAWTLTRLQAPPDVAVPALRRVLRLRPDRSSWVASAFTTSRGNEAVELQENAAGLLAVMGARAKDAVPDLLEALEAAVGDSWRPMAEAIRRIDRGDPRLVSSVAGRLEDGDPSSRRAAVHFLERMWSSARSAIPDLLRGLDHEDEEFSLSCLRALPRVACDPQTLLPRILEILRGDSLLGRTVAAKAAGEIGPEAGEAVPLLIESLRWWVLHFPLRQSMKDALVRIGPEGMAGLERTLEHEDPELRAAAIDALSAFGAGARRAVPALIRSLEDEDLNVVLASVSTLGSIGPYARPAVPAMLEALGDSEFGEERMELARALGRIDPGDEPAVRFLVKTLDGDHDGARAEAALAIASIRPRGADVVPALRRARTSEWPLARTYAAWALERIEPGSLESTGALVDVFRGEPSGDAATAAEALTEYPRLARAFLPELIELLDASDTGVRIATARALGRLGPQARAAAPAISRCLESLDPFASGEDSNGVEEEREGDRTALREACLEALASIQRRES